MEDCTLCPRMCHARREEAGSGFCGLGEAPRLARVAPHLWEEPPISGTRGTGALFFSGCTLRCAYCQNGDISHRNLGRDFTVRELADFMERLVDRGMHTISFITATPFVPAILDALALYRPPVPLVWNTSGYERVETLKLLSGVIDVYLPDLKHRSEAMGRLCAKAPDYFARTSEALGEMYRQVGVPVLSPDGIMQRGMLVRHLILPGLTSESCQLLDWLAETLPGVPVSLMRQYVPMNGVAIKGLDRRITEREYLRVRDHMLALGLPGFEQEAASASEAFVPIFGQDESFI